jgi:hypothetical protein
MFMSKYVRISEGLVDKGFLVPAEQFERELDSNFSSEQDQYVSAYYYNDDHYKEFEKTGTVRGITNVVTDKLIFDLDSKNNIEAARNDALTVVERLKKQNVSEKDIEVYFSGMKGFSVSVKLDRMITPKQHEKLALKSFGSGLSTLDLTIYNASRVIRIPNTKHQVTGLYKVKLSYDQLLGLDVNSIKSLAQKPGSIQHAQPITLDEGLFVEEKVIEVKKVPPGVVDTLESVMSAKPRHWRDYKWALVNAIGLKDGERHQAMMILAATCRGFGYSREIADGFLQMFDDKYVAVTSAKPNPSEKESSLNSVFGEHWNGGQYSYENNAFLKEYCKRIKLEVKDDKPKTVSIDQTFNMFSEYAKNIDALTIKTGIEPLDKHLRMTVGMSVGIVAAPSVGKTSMALQILEAADDQNIPAVFFSYDMYHALVYQKLIQKHFKYTPDQIFEIFKAGDEKVLQAIRERISAEYSKIKFCFESGQTVTDIENTIKEAEEAIGEPIRLIVVDYNELVVTEQSDSTQSSNFVAQKLREIANTRQLCCISLFQPNKMAGSPAEPIKSYRAAKGGSGIEQSVRVMLGMHRPGYNPEKPGNDKYITISCLKNNMGSTFSLDLTWEGLTGTFGEMTDEDKDTLKEIRDSKKAESSGDNSGWG